MESILEHAETRVREYRKHMALAQKDIEKTNQMMQQIGQQIEKSDEEISLSKSMIQEFLKTSNQCALKIISLIRHGHQIEHEKLDKLKYIYHTQIDKFNEYIDELNDEKIRLYQKNHLENQQALIEQLDIEITDTDNSIKKVKHENTSYVKNYRQHQKEFNNLKRLNQQLHDRAVLYTDYKQVHINSDDVNNDEVVDIIAKNCII